MSDNMSDVAHGALYLATQALNGFQASTDKLKQDSFAMVDVAARTTAALAAYTFTAGTAGVGDTIEINANGAAPTVDGVTLVANDPILGAMYLAHGTSGFHNGLWLLTVQGSAGTKAKWTRHTSCDTAAKVRACRFRVLGGLYYGGSEYDYTARATVTMGTTSIFYRRRGEADGLEKVKLCDTDFQWGTVNIGAGSVGNPEGLTYSVASGTVGVLAAGSTTSKRWGIVSLSTSTSATGRASLIQVPSSLLLATDMGFRLDVKFAVPTLSDGTNTYAAYVGFGDAVTAVQANGTGILYHTALTGANVQLSNYSASVATNTDTGVAMPAATDVTATLFKDPGDANIYLVINDVLVATATGYSTANPMGLIVNMLKSLGGTARTLELDWLRVYAYFPAGRA